MNFGKDTIKYIGANWYKLIVFTILPSIALAFSKSPSSFVTLFIGFSNHTKTVWGIYQYLTMIGSRNWLLGILSALLMCFFLSLLFAAIDRHLKIGKFSFSKPISKLNETIMAVLPFFVILILLCELVAFINSAVIVLFVNIMPLNAALGVSIAFNVFLSLLFIMGLSQFVLLIPSEIVAGYPVKDACIYSTRVISGKAKIAVFDMSAAALFIVAVSSIFAIFVPSQKWLLIIVDIILNNYMLMFMASYCMITYFDVSDEPRRDLENKKKKYLT